MFIDPLMISRLMGFNQDQKVKDASLLWDACSYQHHPWGCRCKIPVWNRVSTFQPQHLQCPSIYLKHSSHRRASKIFLALRHADFSQCSVWLKKWPLCWLEQESKKQRRKWDLWVAAPIVMLLSVPLCFRSPLPAWFESGSCVCLVG